MISLQDDIFQIIIHALLASFGAMARQLNEWNKNPLSPQAFISGCIIAAFMGVIVFFLSEHVNINGNVAYAIAGISGWIGPHFLDGIIKQILQALGIKPEDPNKSEDK